MSKPIELKEFTERATAVNYIDHWKVSVLDSKSETVNIYVGNEHNETGAKEEAYRKLCGTPFILEV